MALITTKCKGLLNSHSSPLAYEARLSDHLFKDADVGKGRKFVEFNLILFRRHKGHK